MIKKNYAVKCVDKLKKKENFNVSSWAQVHKVGAGPTTTTIQAKNTFKQKNMNIQKKME